MNNPGYISWKDKYKLLEIIKRERPIKWEDIAYHCNYMSGFDDMEFCKYVMLGLQKLQDDGFIEVTILRPASFKNLRILHKGKIYIYLFPVFRLLYWLFAVGIVSAAAIKTLCDGVTLW